MLKQGLWISVSGIDGSGKTSLCRHIAKSFDNLLFMKIPYFNWARDMIKISGNNNPYDDPHTDMLIFSASNRLEMYFIEQFIIKHDCLLTQRCWLDNFPYRAAQGIDLKQSLHFLKPENFRKPDIIFYLKCNYKTAYNRIKNQKGDKYENLEFMKLLEKEFEKTFSQVNDNQFPIKFPNTKVIALDANKTSNSVLREAESHLKRLELLS